MSCPAIGTTRDSLDDRHSCPGLIGFISAPNLSWGALLTLVRSTNDLFKDRSFAIMRDVNARTG